MQRSQHFSRLIAGLAVMLTLLTVTATQAEAVVGGYVEIHKAVCPVGYEGGAYFEDCHENRLGGITFTALGPDGYAVGDTTGEDGIVVFGEILTAGTVTITEDTIPGHDVESVVFCSLAEDITVPVPFVYVAGGIQLELPVDVVAAGTGVICDWYNIPLDLRGEPTGILELVKLRCETEPVTRIVVFTPLEVAGGLAEAGDDSCRGGTASFVIIPFGDETLDPIPVEAAVGVNAIELPVGDHLLVELGTGATAEFPIEEAATSRVYVLNPRSLVDDGSDETPTEAGTVTSLPNTGTGSLRGHEPEPFLLAASLLLLGTLGCALRMRRRCADR